MKESKQPKASKHQDGDDLISNLPDAILILVLSRLFSSEEAIRTSILSRRWRYLWTAVPSIYIPYRRKLKNSDFTEFLYWVLVNKSVDLDKFHLYCSNYFSMSTVGRWIHAAVTKNVKQLDLRICPQEETEDVEMPHCLVTCGSLDVLKLALFGFGLRFPNNIKLFPALRVLRLSCVDLLEDDNLVKGFLESCPLLEDLTLLDCLTCKLNLLCISCLNLKKLRIFNGRADEGMCGGIKVSCPKLVHLIFWGYIAYDIFFERLDSLKEALIEPILEDNSNTKSVLFPGISHVETLLIDYDFFSQCIKAACDPGLPNLKTLMLTTRIDDFTLDEFIRILKYYPKLKSLKLVIIEVEWELHKDDPRRIFTPDLKRVEFFELHGEKPTLVPDWHGNLCLEIVFSWGSKLITLMEYRCLKIHGKP